MRASLGYYREDGLIKNDKAERVSGSFSLNPSLLDRHLTLGLNVKGSLNHNSFANGDAIWAASTFNPTSAIYSGSDEYGGYSEALDATGRPVNGAVRNPLGLVEQYLSASRVWRVVGNFDIDYKMHFLPELRFHATLGYDHAQGKGGIYVPAEAAQYFSTSGRDYTYGPQKNENRLLTTYLNYNKFVKSIKSSIDVTLGYDYQFWKTTTAAYNELNTLDEVQTTSARRDQRHVLLSYYARLNYTFDSRYMLTATLRRDGTSRFHKDHRWGTFPSVALAWRISQEDFLKNSSVVSDLKLRASYGVTGQQDGIGNYSYLPVYTYSQEGAEVQFGDQWFNTARPEAYVQNLKWESTASWNAGLDFGFLKDRITGSIDFYTRQTRDLLARVPSPAGSNFDKNILTNVGNVDSRGVEFSLNATPVDTERITWDVSFNATWQQMKVKNLSLVEGTATTNTLVGPSIDTRQVQVLTEGYAPYMF
jgi:iron complex outermembrane receptor protein